MIIQYTNGISTISIEEEHQKNGTYHIYLLIV